MAVIRTIQAQRGIEVGGVPNTRVDDSVGQGLQTLGAAVTRAGNVQADLDLRRAGMEAEFDLRKERMAMEMAEFRTDQSLRRFGDDMALDFAKTQQEIDPSGEGFTDQVSAQFNTKAEEFLKTVPPALQPKFSELVRTSRETWLNKAAAAEIDQRNTWYRDGIVKTQEGLQNQVFNDPGLFDSALSDGLRAIDSSGLPQAEKQTLKDAWQETLAITVGEREVRDAEQAGSEGNLADRLGIRPAPTSGISSVVERIIGVESGGKANAKNPNSSAEGLGQFIDSTWLAMVRKHRPDIASGRTTQQILALKADPGLSREMTEAYTADNAGFLKNRGVATTPGNLYLAHFLGPFGAVQALKADPNASVASVMGQDVVRANGFLAGKTIAQLIAWSDKKMGGGGPVGARTASAAPADPRYASLSLDKRLEIYDRAQAAAQRGQTAINAQATAAYDAHKGAMELGIETGEVASPQTILNDQILKDAHKADLLSALRTKQGDAMATGEAVRLFGEGSLTVDPYDSKGKKTVDAVWDEISRTAPQEQLQPTIEELVRQTGVVPQSVINMIRRGLTSKDVATITEAAQLAQRISTVDPSALGRRDGGSEVQKAADDFTHDVNRLNLSPEDAARRIAERRDPAKQVQRKAIEPAAKEFVKEMEKVDLANEFQEWFSGEPDLGFTPGQELGIQAEFIAIAEDQFYAANGDPEIARNRAVAEMKRLYGVTELTGRKVVMKHPPERYWPAFPIADAAQSLSYPMQLQNDIREIDPAADMESVQLVTTPETDAMVKRGEMPGYAVIYTDANGVLQTIPGKLWRPDISKLKEIQDKTDAAEEAEALGNARLEQAQQRQQAPFKVQKMDDFLSGNDPVFGDRGDMIRDPAPKTPEQGITQQRQQLMDDAQDSGVLDNTFLGVP